MKEPLGVKNGSTNTKSIIMRISHIYYYINPGDDDVLSGLQSFFVLVLN